MSSYVKKCLALTVFIYLPVLSVLTYITDSEIWAISLSDQITHFDTLNTSVFYKPLFYLCLKALYLLNLSNVQHLIAARFVFSLIAIVTLIYFYRACRILFQETTALTLTVLLATSNVFLLHSFRVRSDILVMALNMISFYWALNAKVISKKFPFLLLTAINFTIFFVTPKAIYFIFINCLFYYVLFFQGSLQKLRKYWLSMAIVGLLITLVILVNLSFYGLAFDYYTNSVSEPSSSWFFLGHVHRFISRNVFPVLLVILSWSYFFIKSSQIKNTLWRAIYIYSFLCAFILLLHNQRYPFFICSLLPFILIACGPLLESISQKWSPYFDTAVVFIALTSLIMSIKVIISYDSSLPQYKAISFLEDYKNQHPENKIFDGPGLLPRSNDYLAFTSHLDGTASYSLTKMTDHLPDLVVYANRLKELEPELGNILKMSYSQIDKGLWLKNISFRDLACVDGYYSIKNKVQSVLLSQSQFFTIMRTVSTPYSQDMRLATLDQLNNLKISCSKEANALFIKFDRFALDSFEKNANELFAYDIEF